MDTLATEPVRFRPCRESMGRTLARAGAIALVGASVAILVRLRHVPASAAEWRRWAGLAVFVAWISFGGHWVEVTYLNGIRPRMARWSDGALVLLRLVAWLVGGAMLFVGAAVSASLIITRQAPPVGWVLNAPLWGGPLFVAIEMLVHLYLLVRGRASFWNGRG